MNFAKPLAAASLVLGLLSTTLTLAAETSVLNIQDVGQSPVLAWTWGVSNSSSTSSGGGGGAGKATFQDLSLTRATDSQSPRILEKVADGKHIQIVTLQDGPLLFTLNNVVITSYSIGDSTEKKTTQTESITLNFSSFTFQVNAVSTGWDIAANKKL